MLEVMVRECKRLLARPVYLCTLVFAPIFAFIFFTTLMRDGLPTEIPAGVVDEDNSAVTRKLIRTLDAFQMTKLKHFPNVVEARNEMQRSKIHAFYVIPRYTTQKALSSRQPNLSFYTNATFLIPASLEFRDMKMMSELASGGIGRETLYAKGFTEKQAMGLLQPIKIEMHPIGNPLLNYSVYLCNILLPGVLFLLIMQTTIYAIYVEMKEETSKEWLAVAKGNIHKALLGKLLPYIAINIVMGLFALVLLYGVWDFPLNCNIWNMILAMFLLILAAQSFGVFLCGLVPSIRWALSLATLLGVLSFPISGFSFPLHAFPAAFKALANIFPMRHYFLIYVDQALNGLPIYYSWVNFAALIAFQILPLLLIHRLHKFLLTAKYTH